MRQWASIGLLLVGVFAPGQTHQTADMETLRRERDQLQRRSHDQHRLRMFDEALRNAREVVRLTEQLDGVDSRATADALDWLLLIRMDRDEYKHAAELSRRILDLRGKLDRDRPWLVRDAEVFDSYIRRVLELSDKDVERLRETARDLQHADRLDRFGKRDEGIKLIEEALARRKELLGFMDHMYARHFALRATRMSFLEKDADEAVRLLDQALAVTRGVYGEQHRDYAALLQGFALQHRKRGELEKAAELLSKAAGIFHIVLGKDHETSGRSLVILAGVQRALAEKAHRMGKFEEGAKYLAAERATWEKCYGQDHWRVRTADSMQREYLFLAKMTPTQREILDEATNRFESATKASEAGKTAQALEEMTQSVKAFEQVLPRNRVTLKALWNQAALHANAGQRARADAAYRNCIVQTRAEFGDGNPELIERLDQHLSALSQRLDRHIARAEFDAAIRVLRDWGEFELMRYPGQTWREKTIKARIAHLERRATLPRKDQERVAESDRLIDDSLAVFKKNQFRDARALLSKAVQVREELLGVRDYETVQARFSLASVEVRLGNFPEATRNLRLVLDQREQVLGKNHSQYGFALHTLADFQMRTGNAEQAVKTDEEALAILRTTLGKNHPNYANHLIDLATKYLQLRRVDRADDLVEEALPLLETAQGEDRSAYASALNLIGNMYGGVRPEFAVNLFEKACGIWKELNDPLQYAIARDNQGHLYLTLGNLVEAERLHREALNLFRSLLGERHPTTTIGFAHLASLHFAKKEYDKAVEVQRQGLSASRFNLSLASAGQTEQQQLVAFDSFRGQLDLFLTQFSFSKVSPDRAWEEVLAWKGQTLNQQRDNRLARTMPELEPLVVKLRRATTQLASVAWAVPPAAEQRRWRGRVDELTQDREQLEAQLVAAIAEKRGSKPLPPPTATRIKAALPESSALVDFFVYRHAIRDDEKRPPGRYLLAFVVRRGQPVVLVELGSVEAIGTAVDQWRKDYGKETGAAMSKLLWQPLEKHLAGIDLLLVSPDGPLGRFPFAALPGKKPGSYLIEDLSVAVVPVPQILPELLAGEGKLEGPLSLLLAGDIDFDAAPGRAPAPLAFAVPPLPTGEILNRAPKSEQPLAQDRVLSFGPIPDAGKEMSAIAKLFEERANKKPDKILKGNEATEEAFRTTAPGKTHLHLATHGFFAPAQLRSALAPSEDAVGRMKAGRLTRTHPALLSGIALAGANHGPRGDAQSDDGILTAAELAEIDLTKARLVVLSACNTGLGDTAGGEGLLGLQRALHIAGAHSAVTSLWDVPDEATRLLMIEFYTNHWVRKMKTLDALREAQLTLLKTYSVKGKQLVRAPRGERPIEPKEAGRLSPVYWAGFVLSGDWR